MVFEKPEPDDAQSNSDTNDDDPPEPTVNVDGEEMPVTDAVARLVGRVDALQDETGPEMVEVPYADEDEPVPVAVSRNAERFVEAADDAEDATARVETLRTQVRELQETVKDVGALLAEMDGRFDENPVVWESPVTEGGEN
jgi:hypothetical protein